MEREDKYLVIKRADAEKHLTDEAKHELASIAEAVYIARTRADEKQPLKCVVVESDWPMYEAVWKLIEAWVDGGASPSMGCYTPAEAEIDAMVGRFLGWSLPEDFCPDAGISFEPEYNHDYNASRGLPPSRHSPTGTNLFDADQARAMIKHILGV